MPPKKSSKKAAVAKSSRVLAKSKKSIKPVNDTIPQNVRTYWEGLAWTDISDHFDDRTTERGRRYGEGGNVESLWATADGRNLLAVVHGTYEYKTLVALENGRKKGSFALDSTCSCPVGSDCKHGVAVIAKFLDLLAKNTSIPPCTELEDDTWETFSMDGKRKVLKIDFDEFEDDDDDFWDDGEHDWDDDEDEDDYEPPPKRRKSKAESAKSTSKKDDPVEALKSKLNSKSHDALVDIMLGLYNEYNDVREHFKQEAFAESLSKTGGLDKLVDKAIQLIDKGFKGASYDYDYYNRYHGPSGPDLDPVGKVVKQFKRFDDPLPAIDRIARRLIEKGCQYVEQSGAEETDEIDCVFYGMVDVLLASKSAPVDMILWSHEISSLGEYDLGGYAVRKIQEHAWPVKAWSGVADAMLLQNRDKKMENRWGLRTIVETLDKANRQKEATDLLRKEATSSWDCELLADRLINSGLLDEAEKLVLRQQAGALKNNERRHFHYRDDWIDKLKTIAEKRKDWASLASFQAADFFERPSRNNIEPLIKAAKKLKVEPIVRQAVQEFLRTGEFPEFVAKSLAGEKSTPKDKKAWPIPFFTFQTDKRKPEPLLDLLCEWAIDENRPKDVLHWFDECSKHKSKRRDISLREVADAISDMYPDRAFRIYRDQAEHEMEATRNYPEAVRMLRKAQKALEKSGRSAEWPKIIEEVRTTHRRKSSLMKQLNEFEAGSIVKQKMSGMR